MKERGSKLIFILLVLSVVFLLASIFLIVLNLKGGLNIIEENEGEEIGLSPCALAGPPHTECETTTEVLTRSFGDGSGAVASCEFCATYDACNKIIKQTSKCAAL